MQVFLSHRGWANYGRRAKSGRQTVFLNRVLLEHSHAHICLQMVDGHFCATMTALRSGTERMAHKAKNIHSLALYRKQVWKPLL